jgi:hypothetical protein
MLQEFWGLYVPLIINICLVSGETAAISFNLLSFWLLLVCLETDRKYLLAGASILFVISAIARSHFLLLVPLLGI